LIQIVTYVKRRRIRLSSVQKRERVRLSRTRPDSFAHTVIKLSRNWEVVEMLMVIGNGYKIRLVDMTSIINTIHGVVFNYAAISHIFSE